MKIWSDCSGGVLTTELLLVTSVVLTGVATGLRAYADALNAELMDVAASVQEVNQSFSFLGVRSPAAVTAGSDFMDSRDVPVGASVVCTAIGQIN